MLKTLLIIFAQGAFLITASTVRQLPEIPAEGLSEEDALIAAQIPAFSTSYDRFWCGDRMYKAREGSEFETSDEYCQRHCNQPDGLTLCYKHLCQCACPNTPELDEPDFDQQRPTYCYGADAQYYAVPGTAVDTAWCMESCRASSCIEHQLSGAGGNGACCPTTWCTCAQIGVPFMCEGEIADCSACAIGSEPTGATKCASATDCSNCCQVVNTPTCTETVSACPAGQQFSQAGNCQSPSDCSNCCEPIPTSACRAEFCTDPKELSVDVVNCNGPNDCDNCCVDKEVCTGVTCNLPETKSDAVYCTSRGDCANCCQDLLTCQSQSPTCAGGYRSTDIYCNDPSCSNCCLLNLPCPGVCNSDQTRTEQTECVGTDCSSCCEDTCPSVCEGDTNCMLEECVGCCVPPLTCDDNADCDVNAGQIRDDQVVNCAFDDCSVCCKSLPLCTDEMCSDEHLIRNSAQYCHVACMDSCCKERLLCPTNQQCQPGFAPAPVGSRCEGDTIDSCSNCCVVKKCSSNPCSGQVPVDGEVDCTDDACSNCCEAGDTCADPPMTAPFTACQNCPVGTVTYSDDGENLVIEVGVIDAAQQKVDLHVSPCLDIPNGVGNFRFSCKDGTTATTPHCSSNTAFGGSVVANCSPGANPCIVVIPIPDVLEGGGLSRDADITTFVIALHSDVAGSAIQQCCGSSPQTTWGGWIGGANSNCLRQNQGCPAEGFTKIRNNWSAYGVYSLRCEEDRSDECIGAAVSTTYSVNNLNVELQ